MRDAFEAWMNKIKPDMQLTRHPDDSNRYECLYPDWTWTAWQAAQSQPAPPVPSDVQEIMPLVNAYVRACGEFLISGDDSADEALKPLQAALTALVDENHRLRFELDGVNAMRRPLPEEKIYFLAESLLTHQIYGAEVSGAVLFARVIEKLHGIEPEQGGNHG